MTDSVITSPAPRLQPRRGDLFKDANGNTCRLCIDDTHRYFMLLCDVGEVASVMSDDVWSVVQGFSPFKTGEKVTFEQLYNI